MENEIVARNAPGRRKQVLLKIKLSLAALRLVQAEPSEQNMGARCL